MSAFKAESLPKRLGYGDRGISEYGATDSDWDITTAVDRSDGQYNSSHSSKFGKDPDD